MNGFYEKHPEFKGRKLYLSGESYAGHYMPLILHANEIHPHLKVEVTGIYLLSPMVAIIYDFDTTA